MSRQELKKQENNSSTKAKFTTKDLNNSEEKEISNSEFQKILEGMNNELKKETQKLVTDLKNDMNKQVKELREFNQTGYERGTQ
jgi:excinuclease UvrABC nuclease subunit